MTGFSADWLALREPYDIGARNPHVLDAVVASLAGNNQVRIVDLACGTGSTVRALAPRRSQATSLRTTVARASRSLAWATRKSPRYSTNVL